MSGPAILVTGGAGYVGSHCAMALANAGFTPVVFDNLSNGHTAFARFGPFEQGDIRDRARLDTVFAQWRPVGVLHFAALIEVGISVRDPGPFWDVNVHGLLNVLAAMRAHAVRPIVFSSTCATYGAPQFLPLTEAHPQAPLSPYGWTKLAAERAILDQSAAYGVRGALLRYFNAAGAAPEHGLGERHEPETHALPLALFTLLGKRSHFSLFGDDYDTRDGSCVRDYVHVMDLASAHVAALKRALAGGETRAYNLGLGEGVSVLELMSAIARVTGRDVPLQRAARRPGDSPALVADSSRARTELGWAPQHDLDAIVASAWRWHVEMEQAAQPG